MINLSVLNNYLIELDFFTRSFLEQRVRKYGIESVLKAQFECLDCSKRTSKGEIVQQTNGYSYRNELSETIELINNYIEDKDAMFEKLIEIHNENLQWEIDNPPISSKYKRTKNEHARKESKETVAKQKIKAKAAKIGALKLNLKINK